MTTQPIRLAVTLFAALALFACQGSEIEVPTTLGPQDGFDLPPSDLERVAVGTVAPNFYLEAYEGEPMSLSQHRGTNVILVFYRGHW